LGLNPGKNIVFIFKNIKLINFATFSEIMVIIPRMQLVAVGELCQSGGCASRPSGVVAHRRVRGSFPGAALLEAARRDGGERETFACAAALVMQPTLIALFPSFQSRSMSAALLYSLGCCSF